MPRNWRIINSTSDLYVGKSTIFKFFLLGGMVIVSALFVWYTFDVIERLKSVTRSQVETYVRLWQYAANAPTSGIELQFIFDEIIVKATFPIIVTDDHGDPAHWRNIEGIPESPTDTLPGTLLKLQALVKEMKHDNGEYPIYYAETFANYLYYGNPPVVRQLQWMPFVEIGVVLAFMTIGLIGFQNIRRSEERLIWVGMAKETAHQLGTPISSLMGWLEVIGPAHRADLEAADEEKLLVTTAENMSIDVDRLQRVANRFGLIGSVPELKESDVNRVVQEVVEYYRRRLPFEGKGIQLTCTAGDIPPVRLNTELLGWSLENLVKNALQAVDSKTGQVTLTTSVAPDRRNVLIEIADNGVGITVAAARKIFRPGFTTKKRGWGLGLTLVRRIVEEYHNGRIRLVRSGPGETVFHILLPIGGGK